MSGASSVGFEARARKQRRTLARTVSKRKALKLDQKLPFAFRLRQREAWHKLKPGISLPPTADFTRRDLRHVAYRMVEAWRGRTSGHQRDGQQKGRNRRSV